MRLFFACFVLLSVLPINAQIRPTPGPLSYLSDDEYYKYPYNRMNTMDEKFAHLSTVLAERLSFCGLKINPALNFDLVTTYYQLKFHLITQSYADQCSMSDCLKSKELSHIIDVLQNTPQSVPYLIKSYKIEKSIAEDLLKTFHDISKDSQ